MSLTARTSPSASAARTCRTWCVLAPPRPPPLSFFRACVRLCSFVFACVRTSALDAAALCSPPWLYWSAALHPPCMCSNLDSVPRSVVVVVSHMSVAGSRLSVLHGHAWIESPASYRCITSQCPALYYGISSQRLTGPLVWSDIFVLYSVSLRRQLTLHLAPPPPVPPPPSLLSLYFLFLLSSPPPSSPPHSSPSPIQHPTRLILPKSSSSHPPPPPRQPFIAPSFPNLLLLLLLLQKLLAKLKTVLTRRIIRWLQVPLRTSLCSQTRSTFRTYLRSHNKSTFHTSQWSHTRFILHTYLWSHPRSTFHTYRTWCIKHIGTSDCEPRASVALCSSKKNKLHSCQHFLQK